MSKASKRERATEAEWLRWFYENAYFGEHNSDERQGLKMRFMAKTGKNLPLGHNDGYFAGSGETNLDKE